MSLMRLVTFVADGWVLNVTPLTFDAASGITSAVGGTATVAAKRKAGAAVVGTATITGPTTIRCVFAPASMEAGEYEVQVRLFLPGQQAQTVLLLTLKVLASI